jgi:hypothetical protein
VHDDGGNRIRTHDERTIMAATAIAGHKKHSMDKHGRGVPKAGLLSRLQICRLHDKDQRRSVGINDSILIEDLSINK